MRKLLKFVAVLWLGGALVAFAAIVGVELRGSRRVRKGETDIQSIMPLEYKLLNAVTWPVWAPRDTKSFFKG